MKHIIFFETEADMTAFLETNTQYSVLCMNGTTGKITLVKELPHNNEIWYTSSDGNIVKTINSTGISSLNTMGLVSNTYENRKGIMKFSQDITSVDEGAFASCVELTSITIPNSITSIGAGVFYYCTGLTSITIPNSITSIGNFAFQGCSGLASIIVESRNTVYDSRDNCNAIINTSTNELIVGCKNTVIPDSVTSIGEGAFASCTGLTSITIPNSVSSIGAGAFANCYGFTSITIGSGTTTIGNFAFQNCRGLASITVESENTVYDSRDNCNAIINTSTNELIVGCKNTVIPDSVTSIGVGAFYGRRGLTGIIIPNSVSSIGEGSFYGCSGLTNIEIPNSVTSIGGGAFYGCSGLTSIEIPNSVISIGVQAFASCTKLTSVNYTGTMEQWNSITKRSSWNQYVPATVVHCSDGDVTL